jgi:20S proteasome alpha/beta subunit
MTIALGLLAHDGIVVAADTQETVGYDKLSQRKICGSSRTQGDYTSSCLVTGAGHSGYLDAIMPSLVAAFLDTAMTSTGREAIRDMTQQLESRIGQVLRDFYLTHFTSLGLRPDDDAFRFSLVIAGQWTGRRNRRKWLWSTEANALASSGSYVPVGIGSVRSNELLQRLWSSRLTTYEAAVIAAYAVFHAKETVEGVGRFTDLFYVNDEMFYVVPASVVDEMESLFRRFENEYLSPASRYAIGVEDASIVSASSTIRVIRERFAALIRNRLGEQAIPELATHRGAEELSRLSLISQRSPRRSKRGPKRQLPSQE